MNGIQGKGMIKPILFGALVNVSITIVCGLLLARFVLDERIGENSISLMSMCVLLIASFGGARIAMKESKILMIPIGVSAGYLIVLAICGLLLFDGKVISPWVHLVVIALGCAAALFIPNKKEKSKKRRKHRYC